MNGLIVFIITDQSSTLDNFFGNMRWEQDPAFLPDKECIPCAGGKWVNMNTGSGSFGSNQEPLDLVGTSKTRLGSLGSPGALCMSFRSADTVTAPLVVVEHL